MAFETTQDGGRLCVSVSGRLDVQTAPALADKMSGMLDGVTEIVFDLSGLEFISSAGMRILIASYKLMSKRGGVIRVENAQADVMRVLDVSGLASLFDMDERHLS